MDWYDKKTRRNVFRVAALVTLLAAVCLFYTGYQKQNLSEYQSQNSYLHPKRVDSTSAPDMRAAVEREIDSIKKASGGDTPSSFYIHVTPSAEPGDSSAPVAAAEPRKNFAGKDDAAIESSNNVLQGPVALFYHTYTVGVGKTMPVNIRWTEDGASIMTYKLITVKVDDIANNKARFTIEDPFNVLLFSQTGYGVNDKIIIADERHNITLSVLKVNANSVVVKLVSHLTTEMVNKLQKLT